MANRKVNRLYLITEFMLLFFVFPLILVWEKGLIHPSLLLYPFLVLIFFILRHHTDFQWKELWYFPLSKPELLLHLLVAFAVSMLMLAGVYFFARPCLFDLPKGNWRVWLLLSCFYPLFSASAQELIFRNYLFHRYEKAFGSGLPVILVSTAAFSFAHIFYFSVLSLILTFLLGFYLGYVYHLKRSVLFTALLHSLYGNMVFTIGLGSHFWLDMDRWL